MNNIDSVISLVVSEYSHFQKYIDEDSLYREAILSLKEFGGNATEYFETTIDVENGISKLPSNFYRLEAALKCNEISGDFERPEIRTLVESYSIVDYRELEVGLSNCCYREDVKGYSIRTKSIYDVKKSKRKTFGNFEFININRHTNKNSCSSKCFNFMQGIGTNNEATINYRANSLKTNFNTGAIYIRYKGFPVDEEGNLDFTDTANSNFERYMEYALKAKVAELLIGKPGTEGVTQLLSYFAGLKESYRVKVKNELNASNFNSDEFIKRVSKINRKEYLQRALGRR